MRDGNNKKNKLVRKILTFFRLLFDVLNLQRIAIEIQYIRICYDRILTN